MYMIVGRCPGINGKTTSANPPSFIASGSVTDAPAIRAIFASLHGYIVNVSSLGGTGVCN